MKLSELSKLLDTAKAVAAKHDKDFELRLSIGNNNGIITHLQPVKESWFTVDKDMDTVQLLFKLD